MAISLFIVWKFSPVNNLKNFFSKVSVLLNQFNQFAIKLRIVLCVFRILKKLALAKQNVTFQNVITITVNDDFRWKLYGLKKKNNDNIFLLYPLLDIVLFLRVHKTYKECPRFQYSNDWILLNLKHILKQSYGAVQS